MAKPKIPEYRYFPTWWMDEHGPRTWARLRFLEACDNLNIPEAERPSFGSELRVWPPTPYEVSIPTSDFKLPPFNFSVQSATDWRIQVLRLFHKHCDEYLAICFAGIEHLVEQGHFAKIEVARDKHTAIRLRYEWAVRRYCLRQQFKEMASDEHNPDKIRKAVSRVFAEVGLVYRK